MITIEAYDEYSSRLRGIALLVLLASEHHRNQGPRLGGSRVFLLTNSSHCCSWEGDIRAGRAMLPIDRPPPPTSDAVSVSADRVSQYLFALRDSQAQSATRSRARFSPYEHERRALVLQASDALSKHSSPCQGIDGTLGDTAKRSLLQGQRPRTLGLGGPRVPCGSLSRGPKQGPAKKTKPPLRPRVLASQPGP